MSTDVILPILGESISEAVILRWLKQSGEAVQRGDEIAEIESDKATITLESPVNGVILQIMAAEGQTVKTGELLAVIGKPGETIKAPEKLLINPTQPTQPSQPSRQSGGLPVSLPPTPERENRISPSARRCAEELGLDITQVSPAVPGGRVVSEDVERYAASRPMDVLSGPTSHFEQLNELRRTAGRRMAESAQTIPQFSVSMDIAMEAFLNALEVLRPQVEAAGVKASVTSLLAYILGQTLLKHTWLNARYSDGKVQVFETINLALATSTAQGLTAPVIFGLENASLVGIARRIQEISQKARAGTLTTNDLSQATFTLSNLGMYGVTQFIPLVNPPQAAILGVSAIRPGFGPSSSGGQIPQKTLNLTVSADHRLLDGVAVAEFLKTLRANIENCLASQIKIN